MYTVKNYVIADSLEQAYDLKQKGRNNIIIGGNLWLKMGHRAIQNAIDLSRLGLDQIEEDAEGFLFWKKDKKFWIEYSGVVTLGIDVSQVEVEVTETQVTITMPPAEVQSCRVDSSSLTEDSFIVADGSASIDAEDEVAAFDAAQTALEDTASRDSVLLANAQQRAQSLLEDYIKNVGNMVGKEYSIQWIYLDESGEETSSPSNDDETSSETLSSEENQ